MRISAQRLCKHFGGPYVVRDFTYDFAAGSRTAIAGPNGSGKSTLLRLLSGLLLPTSGETSFSESGNPVDMDQLYSQVSLCGPYTEMVEELTGAEAVVLHAKLRGFRQNTSIEALWERIGWARRITKQPIKTYSSGMKQRLRLAVTLASTGRALLLDEPTSNLDAAGVEWYEHLLTDWCDNRTLIIASNESRDFVACGEKITAAAWCSS